MIGLLQRVTEARVQVEGVTIGAIAPDREGKMNLSLTDIRGGLLLVPQFTLPADTKKGMRPSFTPAAAPAEGERLFHHLLERAQSLHAPIASGRFGAHMQVTLTNNGPVTLWLRVEPKAA
jgi:D-tyrosyl-tRNA(Tyr) deacylase